MYRSRLLAAGRHVTWLIALLMLAACNLNTTTDVISRVIDGPPVVQIVAPLPNATFLTGVGVNIQARVSNAGDDISRVEVAVGDDIISTLENPNEAGSPAFSITQTWPAASAGAYTLMVTAFREDGTASTPATVSINVISQAGQTVDEDDDDTEAEEDAAAPTPTQSEADDDDDDTAAVPLSTLAPTDEPEPTDPPAPEATATPSVPTATFTTGVNVRRGPGTVFDPPIGSFAANQTSEVLAVSPDRAWYKVKYYNGEGWVFANLMSVSGDAGNLPVDPGPATPIPVTNTPIPPTPVPVTNTPTVNINLVAGNIRTEPGNPRCGETFNIFVDILNGGTDRWNGGGIINVSDTAGGNTTTTVGAIPAIDPGQTVSAGPIPLTVNTNFDEEHTIVIDINPDSQVPETNRDDNRREYKYTLRKAGCG